MNTFLEKKRGGDRKITKKKGFFIKEYHTPGCAQFIKRAKNAVFFNNNNSVRHELAKAVGALMLGRYGDIKFSQELIDQLRIFANRISFETAGFKKNKTNFVTEAVPNKEPDRRIDLVNVDDNARYEFETNKKVKKKNCVTIYV